jgi:hypothetical protein
MTAPNIVEVATITGKTAVQLIGTSATAIVSNSAASGKVFKINSLYISNVDGLSNAEVTIDVFRSSVAYRLALAIQIPTDSTLDFLQKPIYLEEGDSLRLTANAASDLEAICSYEEIS